jgi:pyruvate/2-oxoglutarate dehydrogenase complex dihydrolipoamide acyltransferase (E2) component
MTDFTMPALGADMDQGTVLEWLVAPGDVVHKGDLMAVVDTSKSAIEVESFSEGVVADLVVPVGAQVPVGTVLAHLTPLDGSATAAAPAAPEPEAEPAVEPPTAPAPPPSAHAPAVHSPLVRKRAHELGVDLDAVAGSGPGGEITREDVNVAATTSAGAPTPQTPAEPPRRPAAAPPSTARPRITPYARRLARELGVDLETVSARNGETVRAADVRAVGSEPAEPTPPEPEPAAKPPGTDAAARARAMRETIARLMARSKREIPHYYLTTTVDMSAALAWMREQNTDLPIAERLVPAALLLRATAVATARHGALNGFWVDDAFQPGSGVHLGVAISLRGGGLVAPAIHDADQLSVTETMAAMRDLVTRARAGRLRGSEMTDPTLTVTNLGEQGVESVYGVIYPPQVALVGFGRVVERAWAVDGMLGVRPITTLTLAADHRATDGFTGGRFLATVDELLQHPEEL